MAGHTCPSAFEDGLARVWGARSPFSRCQRAEALHEGNHLPDFVVGGANCRHFRAADPVSDGGVQIGVGAAVLVLAGGQVGSPAALATRAVAVSAVSLKERGALLGILRRGH